MLEITVQMPSGVQRTFPYGTRVSEVLNTESSKTFPEAPIGGLVNNQLTSLFYKLEVNSSVEPVFLDSGDGVRLYRNSLCFLLYLTIHELFPDRRLVIGHSLGNGYFYYFDNILSVDPKDLEAIEKRMRELVNEKLPIQRKVISYMEALDYFKQTNQPDTVQLLEQRNEVKIPVYVLGDFIDLAHGPLVPNTEVLEYFELRGYNQGFLLRYPSHRNTRQMKEFKDSPLLYSIYQEYKAWGKILGINSVAKLNEVIYAGEVENFIRIAETLHDKKIAEIADRIHEKRGKIRIILVAGPSSSGKTTFTKKLAIHLKVVGFNPVVINLDNYFVPRHLNPVDENGDLDFEVLEAIDVPLLNDHLVTLFEGGTAMIPDFDFKTGSRKGDGKKLSLSERSILIMEGIHGLNDSLTPRVPAENKYKIYVSALTQLNLDDHNRISTTDNRLLRRLVRDYQFRGYSALDTLSRWPSVRRGENRNIFPFQDNADSAFNSALDYELAVLKVFAEPLLKTVKPGNPLYKEAVRLLSFLNNFIALPAVHVPELSILREFIGHSGFKY